ncbi:MAG: Ig-like domain-containing protein [Lachnospiraceae bacterium]|nr:Ig-like domain-containing protein [Lachnospiraceae bacterium]
MKGFWKKGMVTLLTAALLAGSTDGALPVWQAAKVKAAESEYVPLNQKFTSRKEAYFELTEHGVVTFENNGKALDGVEVYRILEDGNEVCYAGETLRLRLTPGKYKADFNYEYEYEYIDKINFVSEESLPYTEKEWNDNFDDANEIQKNIAYTGNLNKKYSSPYSATFDYYISSDQDYYRFELEQAGTARIQYSIEDLSYSSKGSGNWNSIMLYNEDEEGNTKEICSIGSSDSNKTRYSSRYRLPKGIYYIRIRNNDSYDHKCNVSDYQLKVNYEPESSDSYEQEYNDTEDTANEISTNTGYTGNISISDDKDYYKFTLPTTSRVNLKMQVPRQSENGLFHAVLHKVGDSNKITEVKTTTNPIARSTETLLEAGDYYVMVENGSSLDSMIDYTLTVEAKEVVVVQEITVTPEKTPAYKGDKFSMIAEITPENAENKKVSWTSSDTSVAKIDENGVVTCVGAGNVLITATAQDGSQISGTYLLKVKKLLVDSIMISAPYQTAEVGSNLELSAKVTLNNVSTTSSIPILWESSDESIAQVSEDGKVTCKAAGTVTITATAEDESRKAGTFLITVIEKPKPTVIPEQTEAPVPSTEVTAAPIKETKQPLKTLEPKPTVMSEQPATALPSTEVTTTPIKETEQPLKTQVPKPTVMPEQPTTETPEETKLPFRTLDPTISDLNPTKPDVTIIPTVTSGSPVTPTDDPNKDPDFEEDLVKTITLSSDLEEDEEIRVGDKFSLYAEITPEEAEDTEILWSTSNAKVATVNKKGQVVCVGKGKVTIKAEATDGSGVSSNMTFTILKAKSKNNYLSKISISQGKLTPAFKKTKTSYTIILTKKMSKVIIKPVVADKSAVMTINGSKTTKKVVKLKSGKRTTISIKVKAENGKSRTYKIIVKRR